MTDNTHRHTLAAQAVEVLQRYQDFPSNYRVSFSLAQPDAKGLPLVAARLTRPDGVPFAQSGEASDRKLAHLQDQTAILRPFYLPKMKKVWEEEDANAFTTVDFDFALILGYGQDEAGTPFLKDLYLPSADAFLTGRRPQDDGVYRIPLGSFNASRMSLDPRKKFARFLYLAERMGEALEYQYDKQGFFYSSPQA